MSWPSQARRLMKRPDARVVRTYGLNLAEVRGAERDALLARVAELPRTRRPKEADRRA